MNERTIWLSCSTNRKQDEEEERNKNENKETRAEIWKGKLEI